MKELQMKKVLSVILTLTVVLASLQITVFAANSYSSGEVVIDTFTSGDLQSAVEGTGATAGDITSLVITEGVVNADDFAYIVTLSSLTSLEISGNATVHSTSDSVANVSDADNTVPEKALQYSDITSLTISAAETIGKQAFYGCDLVNVSLDKVETVEFESFRQCPFVSISLPELTTIGRGAFYGCTSLKTVDFPLVEVVGKSAFASSTIESINFLNVTEIGQFAFHTCNQLASVNLPEVITVGERAFEACANLTGITISKVTSLGDEAFRESGLESISLPVLEVIDNKVFYDCNNLTSVTLGKVTRINNYAFSGCGSLNELVFGVSEPPILNGNGTENKLLIFENGCSPKYLTVPAGSENNYLAQDDGDTTDDYWYGWDLRDAATQSSENDIISFSSDDEVGAATIDDTAHTVNLTVVAGADITTLSPEFTLSPFAKAEVGTVEQESGVTENDFTNPVIYNIIAEDGTKQPWTVTVVEEYVFDGAIVIDNTSTFTCGNLKSAIDVQGEDYEDITSLTISTGVVNETDFFFMRDNLVNLETLIINGDATVHSTVDIVVKADADRKVANNALYNQSNWMVIATLTISDATVVGENAFYGLDLTNVSLNNVVEIEEAAFKNNYQLQGISMGNLTTVNKVAFSKCTSLLSVDFPKLESIGNNAFAYTGLESVDFQSENLTEIETGAFAECTSLAAVRIPALETVGSSVFVNCMSLENISIPNVTEIGSYAFKGSGLEGISLPKVEKISREAFSGCSELSTVSLSVATNIEYWAFKDCTSLSELKLDMTTPPSLPNTDAEKVFENCPASRNLAVPSGAEAAYGAVVDGDNSSATWYGWNILGTVTLNSDNNITAFSVPNELNTARIDDVNYKVAVVVPSTVDVTAIVPTFTLSQNASAYVNGTKQVSGVTSNDFTNTVTYTVNAEDGISQNWDVTVTVFDGTLVIDDNSAFTCGNLEEVVTDLNIPHDLVTGVIVTAGVINQTDMHWMRDNFANLESLEISGNATVHSTSDVLSVTKGNETTVGDNIVPAEAMFTGFYNNILASVEIANAIGVGDSAFTFCSGLTSINMPNLTSVGESAFYKCGLSEVNLPIVVTLGGGAFGDNAMLSKIEMPLLESFGQSTFSGCIALENISLPKVTLVGRFGFQNCTGLKSVDLPSIDTISYEAFLGCTSLESVSLGEIQEIGQQAFEGCTYFSQLSLTSVTPPTVAGLAFNGCPTDRTVTVLDNSGATYRQANDDESADNLWYGWTVVDNGVVSDTTPPILSATDATGSFDVNTNLGEVIVTATSNEDGKIYVVSVFEQYYGVVEYPTPSAIDIVGDGEVFDVQAGVPMTGTFSSLPQEKHSFYFVAVDAQGNRSEIVHETGWIIAPNPDEDDEMPDGGWGPGDEGDGTGGGDEAIDDGLGDGDEAAGDDNEDETEDNQENDYSDESDNSDSSLDSSSSSSNTTKYTLIVSSTEGGSSTFEGTSTYESGTIVDLEITVEEGYQFVGYEGNTMYQDATTYDVIMNDDIVLEAVFEKIEKPEPQEEPQSVPTPVEEPEPQVVEDGQIPESNATIEQILDAEVPESDVPQTGGLPLELFALIGSGLSGVGYAIKRKK